MVTGSEWQEALGRALAGVGDLDGDGFDDLAVGSVHKTGQDRRSGGVALLYGTADVDDVARATLFGESFADHAGMAMAAAGDLDGDGDSELLVGAPLAEPMLTTEEDGVAYLVPGSRLGGVLNLQDVGLRIRGEAPGDHAGKALLGAGDLDGDGVDDFAIGSDLATRDHWEGGAVHVVLGPLTGALDLADAAHTWHGTHPGERAGRSLAGGADLDGDGHNDLLVGAYKSDLGASDGGAVYGLTGLDGRSLADAALVVTHSAPEARLATSMAVADFDGDDHADVALGASAATGQADWSGAVVVLRGPLSGRRSAAGGLWLDGIATSDRAGGSLAAVPDVDGGGLPELLIGAQGHDAGGAEAGAAWLWLGEELPW